MFTYWTCNKNDKILLTGAKMLFLILIGTIGSAQIPSKMIESSTILPESLPTVEKAQFDQISTAKFIQQTANGCNSHLMYIWGQNDRQ
jgi:hypothetical protein